MLALTKVKMSGSEKKMNKDTYDISHTKRIISKFWKFHVVAVQNNCKEVYKKRCVFWCKVAFLLIRPIVVFFTLLFSFIA